jgi:hypothetical protein
VEDKCDAVVPAWSSRALTGYPVPYDATQVHRYVLDRMRLPITVPRPGDAWDLTEAIVVIWKEVVREVEVDGESWCIDADSLDSDDFIHHMFVQEMDPAHGLYDAEGHRRERDMALNIATWYDGARDELLRRTRLMRVPVAGPRDYPKHFPGGGARTLAQLKARSVKTNNQDSTSQLRFGLDGAALEEFVHVATAEFACELVAASDASVFRGFVDCMIEVGYTRGEATQVLCVEWSPQMAHVYPVARGEITSEKVVFLDDLQGVVRDVP